MSTGRGLIDSAPKTSSVLEEAFISDVIERDNEGQQTERYPIQVPNKATKTPLPWRQLMLVFGLRAVKPLMFELIFPFVNQMILEIGVVDDPEGVGFYSGLLESVFACMSFVCIIPCSVLSDRFGRKPVILATTSGLAISAAFFGFSKSFWFMIFTRCIGGGSGGNVASLKTMLAELTDKTNEAIAQTGFAIAYRLGQGIGQPIGGLLSHPERHVTFFDSPFWRKHPFALPGLSSAAIALVLVVMGHCLLHETLPLKRRKSVPKRSYGAVEPTNGFRDAQNSAASNSKSPTWSSVIKSTPGLYILMFNRALLYLAVESMFALYPLFSFTPIPSGGLGSSEADIGITLSFRALLMLLFMFSSPRLLSRWGSLRLYRFAMALWPATFGLLPVLNNLARRGESGKDDLLFGVVHALVVAMWALSGLAFPAAAVMVNNISPTAESINIIISMSELVNAFVEAVSPAFVNSTFAFSIKHNIAGGRLTYVIMVSLTTVGFVQSFWLEEQSPAWRDSFQSERETDNEC